MKKSLFITLFSLNILPALADGHNLDGLVYYYLGIAVLFFGLPFLILTVLSLRNYFRPGKTLFITCAILLLKKNVLVAQIPVNRRQIDFTKLDIKARISKWRYYVEWYYGGYYGAEKC